MSPPDTRMSACLGDRHMKKELKKGRNMSTDRYSDSYNVQSKSWMCQRKVHLTSFNYGNMVTFQTVVSGVMVYKVETK